MRMKKSFLIWIFFSCSIVFASDFEGEPSTQNGLFLFKEAITRYWMGTGSAIGNLGLLEQAAIAFDYISDPAIRNYYMARTELYKGYVTRESRSPSEVRTYFREAMRFAELSLKHLTRSDTYRVLAEAGNAWIRARKIHIKPKRKAEVIEWIQNALFLDPQNISAELLKLELEFKRAGRIKKTLEPLRVRLEELEAQPDIDNIMLFRTRILLSEVCRKLRDKEAQNSWLDKAAAIFPKSPMLQ